MPHRNWKLNYGVVAVASALVVVSVVMWPMARGIFFLGALVGVSLATLSGIGAFRDLDGTMRHATALFFVLKIMMSILTLEATTLVFAGSADALASSHVGASIAMDWKMGLPVAHGSIPGDGSVQLIVGYLYSFTVTSQWIGFLVFSWISAVGTILIWYGASRTWTWENRKKLGLALMFLPSLMYWTSTISKEAIVILGMGFFICGIGLVFEGRKSFSGVLLMVFGSAITGVVRPNITLLLLVSAVAALLLPWSRTVIRRTNPTVRLAAVIVLLLVLIPVVAATRQLLHLAPDQGFIQGGLNVAQSESSIGGNSSFAVATPTSFIGVPYAIISVLFRPFPWEVRTPLMLLSSLESLGLIVWSARVILRWHRRLIRPRLDGLMLMSIMYLLVFCFLFSSLGNFGLLVRERVQVLPFLLIILTSFDLSLKNNESGNLLTKDDSIHK
jgi:hypothetical protein